MTELLTVIGMLAIVLIGIAVVLQLISVEDAIGLIGRAMAALFLVILALCILKNLWVGAIVPGLWASFKFFTTLIRSSVMATFGVGVLLTVGRIVFSRFSRYLPLRRDPLNGDRYEIHDAKEERD